MLNGCAVRITTGKWSDDLGDIISEGKVIPQFEVELTSYQKINRYLLSDESDPQLQTALDRVNSVIAARKEAEAQENGTVTPSDSTATTAKNADKTTKNAKTTKDAKTTKETKATTKKG